MCSLKKISVAIHFPTTQEPEKNEASLHDWTLSDGHFIDGCHYHCDSRFNLLSFALIER